MTEETATAIVGTAILAGNLYLIIAIAGWLCIICGLRESRCARRCQRSRQLHYGF
jgi:hypothetical protein